ncbi:MAG: GTPase ObgE [Firmicutes bacterium]|nr:GTPase ObgE [Bacillota bacterium]
MFIDKIKILIKAGDGGNGCTSFYTEKYVPDGGPDGGDGGAGGDLIIKADKSKNTLSDFNYLQKFRAGDGEKGSPKHCHGKRGNDLTIKVPAGTLVKDEETGQIIADLFFEGQEVTVLIGGAGGKGNARFKTSRRQAPHFSQSGEVTSQKSVVLELKMIADVGLVGYPNVGKSTLLSVISSAKPKIADYHFTTLYPNLGVVRFFDKSFVAADIPGLIEGAASGAGLGHEFLRHIDRTRLLIHVVDISGFEGREPFSDYQTINKELKLYSKDLAKLPQIIALNKIDVLGEGATEAVKEFKKHIKGRKVFTISGTSGLGLDELVKEAATVLESLPPAAPLQFEPFVYGATDKNDFRIERNGDAFVVTGGFIDELSRGVAIDDYDSFNYFQKRLKERGIIKALVRAGLTAGDAVRILDMEFEFDP